MKAACVKVTNLSSIIVGLAIVFVSFPFVLSSAGPIPPLPLHCIVPSKWHKNIPAAFSFTIDDGVESTFLSALPLLKRHKIPATLFLSTWFVGQWNWTIVDEQHAGEFAAPEAIRQELQSSWSPKHVLFDQIHQVIQEGFHEIASHSTFHQSFDSNAQPWWYDAEYDLNESVNLMDMLHRSAPGQNTYGFAWPFGQLSSQAEQLARNKFLYARGIICRLNDATPENWMNLFACELGSHETDTEKFDRLLHLNQRRGTWLIEFMHGISDCGEHSDCDFGYSPIDPTLLEKHLDRIAKLQIASQIWVETTGNIARYIKQRDALIVENVVVSQLGPTQMQMTIQFHWGFVDPGRPVPLTINLMRDCAQGAFGNLLQSYKLQNASTDSQTNNLHVSETVDRLSLELQPPSTLIQTATSLPAIFTGKSQVTLTFVQR